MDGRPQARQPGDMDTRTKRSNATVSPGQEWGNLSALWQKPSNASPSQKPDEIQEDVAGKGGLRPRPTKPSKSTLQRVSPGGPSWNMARIATRLVGTLDVVKATCPVWGALDGNPLPRGSRAPSLDSIPSPRPSYWRCSRPRCF